MDSILAFITLWFNNYINLFEDSTKLEGLLIVALTLLCIYTLPRVFQFLMGVLILLFCVLSSISIVVLTGIVLAILHTLDFIMNLKNKFMSFCKKHIFSFLNKV